ncbi:hypothetical protein [uncultured Draconibacterium sp.]|uniref:hypothetical protein n=1 Tax=uncultured Draconibacterium sp. TaxID=1573823 RepID=UPI0029C897C4|nr:hypothetical protein [uncultured Draconibacterium sp.]
MRYLSFICLMILFLSSSGKANQNSAHVRDFTFDINKSDYRVNLDSLLEIETNDYLAFLVNGELTLCGYKLLHPYVTDLEMFQENVEEYNLENEIKKVDIFVFGSSYIKLYYNDHPRVKNRDVVCGKILSDKIKLNHGIKIGMSKVEILEKIFRPTPLFQSINRLIIYEDESGEAWTELIFKQDILKQVNYDSDYDWIDKKIK